MIITGINIYFLSSEQKIILLWKNCYSDDIAENDNLEQWPAKITLDAKE